MIKTLKRASESKKKPPDLYSRSRAQFRNERHFMFQGCVHYFCLFYNISSCKDLHDDTFFLLAVAVKYPIFFQGMRYTFKVIG